MSRTGKLSAAALIVLAAATAATSANAKSRQVRCDPINPWYCTNVLVPEVVQQQKYPSTIPIRNRDYTDPRDNPTLMDAGGGGGGGGGGGSGGGR